MAIQSVHPQWTERRDQWRRCRDCFEGVDAVRGRGIEYLPPLSEGTDYRAYLERAHFYPAFSRTVEALIGVVLRHPPEVSVPAVMEKDMEDLDLFGSGINRIVEQVIREILISGRVILLQDVYGQRIYWRVHQAVDLRYWWGGPTPVMGGGLSEAIVEERGWRPASEDEIPEIQESSTLIRYRFGDTPDSSIGEPGFGALRQEWRDDASGFQLAAEFPLRLPSGQPLDVLPVHVGDLPSETAIPYSPPKPTMLDVADLSLSYFRTSADLEHALHFVALPTPWISAPQPPKNAKIGSSEVWYLGSTGSAGILEVQGPGMAALETALGRKARQLAGAGARVVTEPVRHAETATAAQIKASGDRTLLHCVVDEVERVVGNALRLHQRWMGYAGEEPSITLNRDWIDTRLSPADISGLVQLVQDRLISPEAFANALVRGEWLRPAERYVPEIKEPAPMPPALAAAQGQAPEPGESEEGDGEDDES